MSFSGTRGLNLRTAESILQCLRLLVKGYDEAAASDSFSGRSDSAFFPTDPLSGR